MEPTAGNRRARATTCGTASNHPKWLAQATDRSAGRMATQLSWLHANYPEAFMTPRYKLPPGGDVPPVTAAHRIGLSLEAFRSVRRNLSHVAFHRLMKRPAFSTSVPSRFTPSTSPRCYFRHRALAYNSCRVSRWAACPWGLYLRPFAFGANFSGL